jgi:hypothetical protein
MTFVAAMMMAAAAQSGALPELLACRGSTIGSMATGSQSTVVQDSTGKVVTGRSVDSEVREIGAVMQFRLNGDDPRANIPRILAPETAVSKGGWYRVRELQISEDFVRGRMIYNLFESSRFEIDRRTGILTTTDGFQGDCEAVDVNQRKF